METTPQRSVLSNGTSEVVPPPHPTFNGLWTEDWHCQFCGVHADDYYMIQPELWERIIGKPYHYGSGYACLGCAADRLYPRQLRNEDFNDPGGGEDEDGRLNLQWIDDRDLPGFAAYCITFPEEGDTVRITVDEDWWGWPNDQFNLIEALENERFGWLWEYTAAHGLKLQWLDDVIYQPRFEGLGSTRIVCNASQIDGRNQPRLAEHPGVCSVMRSNTVSKPATTLRMPDGEAALAPPRPSLPASIQNGGTS